MAARHRPKRQRWTKEDRLAFTTQRLRAQTIPGKRRPAPTAEEWVTNPHVCDFLATPEQSTNDRVPESSETTLAPAPRTPDSP